MFSNGKYSVEIQCEFFVRKPLHGSFVNLQSMGSITDEEYVNYGKISACAMDEIYKGSSDPKYDIHHELTGKEKINPGGRSWRY